MPKRRSGCPVSVSLEMIGDRWSLLIIRDLMIRGYRTFKEFEDSGEGVATNILSDRLRKLKSTGIIVAEVDAGDRRKVNYRLTQKGIDLAPVLRSSEIPQLMIQCVGRVEDRAIAFHAEGSVEG